MNTKKSKNRKSKFPNIYRFISDIFEKHSSRFNRKIVFGVYSKSLRIFTLFIFIVAIVVLGFDLNKNIEDRSKIDLERSNIAKEIGFWQSFLKKNKDYRDGYLQLSILEYKLRDYSMAKLYLNKALEIDPNFEKGKELKKVFGIQ